MKKFFSWFMSGMIAITLCACSLFRTDYAEVLEKNWGFTLPKDSGYTEIYKMQTEASFHGDGFRYHVFSCTNAQPIENTFSWTSVQHRTNFYDDFNEACEGWLNEIGVPQSERPVYAECVYYYDCQNDLSEIIMLFSETQSKLYVVESFL